MENNKLEIERLEAEVLKLKKQEREREQELKRQQEEKKQIAYYQKIMDSYLNFPLEERKDRHDVRSREKDFLNNIGNSMARRLSRANEMRKLHWLDESQPRPTLEDFINADPFLFDQDPLRIP